MPLPSMHYEYMERKTAKVSSDFHVRFDNAYYSVDKAFLHKKVSVKASSTVVRIYSLAGELLCEWPRATRKGQWSTNPEHLPDNYKGFSQWNGPYFIQKAQFIGKNTETVIRTILKSRPYEVQTYRMCLGILNFTKKYSNKALEECCKQAITLNKQKYTFIKNTISVVADDLGEAGHRIHLNPRKSLLTGTELVNELVDELNELKLSTMAATLDDLYHRPGFLEMDRLTMIAELIGPQFQEKVSTTLKNRLTAAHLKGSPEELVDCVDSDKREYLPSGITEMLSSLDFIERGYNLCILGESDAGKSYLAKAIGIKACNRYNVGYFHSEELLESMVALKEQDYDKYARKMKKYLRWELIILDDFLLHTITDEREIKILFELLEKRNEQRKSTIVCSQRDPVSWKAMILNDEVSANSIMKRATKHYTIKINTR